MILDLLRHASTGRPGHLDGRTDPPLIDGALDTLLQRHGGGDWSRVIASPRRRALDTATALLAGRDLFCEIHPDWAELDFGDWDGRHYDEIPVEVESLPLPSPQVTFRLEIDYTDMRDTARFLVRTAAGWIPIGHPHRLWFKLDHFTGCRFALFTQATQHVGGHADFMRFRYHDASDMGA